MNAEMSTASSIEIEEYCEAVRLALADLPSDVRDDLLEDLPDHLSEIVAEGEGTLRERLGEPVAYADELLSAAGLEPTGPPAGTGARAGLAALGRRGAAAAGRMDVGLGRLVGYARLVDLLRALRPGWWVLRGWIVAQFVCGVRHGEEWTGFVPTFQGSRFAGLVLTVAAVVASVWLGRRSSRMTSWPRGLITVIGAAAAVWALTALPSALGQDTIYISPASSDPYNAYPDLSDVYVYDQSGQPVVGARLYDQSGNPLQLGDPVCADGNPAPGTSPDVVNADGTVPDWTYPLCPNDPGPFRSGPGAVTPTGAASSAAPSTAPAPSSAAPPVSKAPVSKAPVSQAPTSKAPTSQAPAGKASGSVPTASPRG